HHNCTPPLIASRIRRLVKPIDTATTIWIGINARRLTTATVTTMSKDGLTVQCPNTYFIHQAKNHNRIPMTDHGSSTSEMSPATAAVRVSRGSALKRIAARAAGTIAWVRPDISHLSTQLAFRLIPLTLLQSIFDPLRLDQHERFHRVRHPKR